MSALIREPNITGHDDIYEALVRLHDDLDDAAERDDVGRSLRGRHVVQRRLRAFRAGCGTGGLR